MLLCSALCAPCASGPAMNRTAPLLGTGSTGSGGPTRPRPSCRSRRVPCAGLSCRPVAPSVVRGSYAVMGWSLRYAAPLRLICARARLILNRAASLSS